MKKTLIAVAAALAVAAPAYAVDEHHPEKAADTTVLSPDKAVQKMKENLVEMQTQLDRVAAADNAEERQKLLTEHMQTMRENMMLGHQMAAGDGGCPMHGTMAGGMGMPMGMMGQGGMMMGPSGPMMGSGGSGAEAMMNRMQQMERRLDMMQMMLERQMGAERPAAPKR